MKKKIFLFLTILFGSSFLSPLCVHASTQFYEAEYIPDVFVIKQHGNIKDYAQGRVLRNKETDEIAYCLQPFVLFNGEDVYESAERIESLRPEVLQQIEDIVRFSYPLGSSNLAYYMATQLKIWQILEPDCEFYFTDTLNGNKTNKYNIWFDVINDNVRVYNQAPSYANQTYATTVNGSITFEMPASGTYEDTLETDLKYQKKYSTVTFSDLKEGDYEVKVRRRFKTYSQQPILFYYGRNSQTLINRFGTEDKIFSLKIHVVDASILVKKIDKDTKTKQASGEASLEGAIFSLYNEEGEKLATFSLDKSLEKKISVLSGTIKDLPFGNYKIKEEQAGEGYLCNPKTFDITLDEEHPHIELLVENEVIKNKVTLEKYFGNENLFKAEAGVLFEIYNQKNELVKTIETDEEGKAIFELPYGTYIIHQKTSKEGYQTVDDFKVIVKEEKEEHHYVLYDQEEPQIEIEVPNTRKESPFPWEGILTGALLLFYAKKTWI